MPAGAGRQPVYDTTKGTVNVWSAKGTIPAIVADIIPGDRPRVAHRHTGEANGPALTAAGECVVGRLRAAGLNVFYVHGGSDNASVQRQATRCGARHGAISLPAAADWLRKYVQDITGAGTSVDIVVHGGAW